ncbi:MAG: aminomethyl-transferring glycine dehydrogenase subunit GcvPA [Caldisericia bacterium]|jgi:glycine dehydrogenase subunit 1|nr:aminomethyl-transferring glycine dehydrogenase subunit GcvPA [Caldisericia bacterium]
MKFIPHTEKDIEEMLHEIGISSIDELFEDIPEEIKLKRDLNLPPPLNELELKNEIDEILSLNLKLKRIFLGGGAYFHFIPATVNYVLSRGEFYTSYTPYQPELSQGILQALFEFQSILSDLTHADVTNSSMYDGATSLVEAIFMAERIKKRGKVLVSRSLNPEYNEVLKTYLPPREITLDYIDFNENGEVPLEKLKEKVKEGYSSFVIQSPNYFGIIENLKEIGKILKESDTLFILTITEGISLGILKPPFDFGVDILAMEGQSFGIPLSFGGPYLGILQTKKEYIREIPGRIIGETKDRNGKRAYVMTLRAREQDIKRDKATSNICTNNSLNALAALVYLSTLGPSGFKKVAEINYKKAHYLAKRLIDEGFELKFKNLKFFNEFVLKLNIEPIRLKEKLSLVGIEGGIPLRYFGLDDSYLFTVTEMNSREDIELLVCALKEG